MHQYSDEIIENYMVRKSKKQKRRFIERVEEMLGKEGYQVDIEKGGILASKNIVVGDVKKAKVIMTAHYDTCALCPFPNIVTPRNILAYVIYQFFLIFLFFAVSLVIGLSVAFITGNTEIGKIVTILSIIGLCVQIMIGFPNKNTYNDNTSGVVTLIEIAMKLPEEYREKLAFVFFDNEELGLVGSRVFYKKHHREIKDKLVINLDCVSDGDHMLVIANRSARKDQEIYGKLKEILSSTDEKEVRHVTSGTTFYPSDQMHFKKSIAISGMRKAPIIGYYVARLHTPFDTKFDKRNISLLKDTLVKFVCEI